MIVNPYPIKVKKLSSTAILPTYANNDNENAGIDFYAIQDYFILPGRTIKIGTGIAIDFSIRYNYPDQWARKLYMKLESGSGLASKGIFVVGGVIDQNYRGEIGILLYNSLDSNYLVKQGDRIAQGIIHEINFFEIIEVQELIQTDRGANGFGSSGE